jgi:hypothetical protein
MQPHYLFVLVGRTWWAHSSMAEIGMLGEAENYRATPQPGRRFT